MKIFLVILFSTSLISGFSQTVVEVNQSTTAKARSVYDLVSYVPSGCNILTFNLVFNQNGKISVMENQLADTTITSKGKPVEAGKASTDTDPRHEWRRLVNNAKPGATIYIEIIKLKCDSKMQMSYKFIVTEK